MAAAAMATLATVEAATITPLSYPDACEGNLSAALRVSACGTGRGAVGWHRPR
jgi:hypothetical protein